MNEDTLFRRYYQEEYDSVHAPTDLKEKTIQRMHKKNNHIVKPIYRFIAIAAILVIGFFGVSFFGKTERIPVIHAGDSAINLPVIYRAKGHFEMTETEVDNNMETQFPEHINGFYKTDSRSWIVEGDNGAVVDSVSLLIYEKEEAVLNLLISVNELLSPPELFSVDAQEIAGTPIYLGKDKENGFFYASWADGEYLYSASMTGGNDRQFLRTLKLLIEK